MRTKTKRTLLALLSAFLISFAAFGLSGALAETSGNWTGTTEGGGSATEAYLTPNYEVSFEQGFILNQMQKVEITVSPNACNSDDYRACLSLTAGPRWGDVTTMASTEKGLILTYNPAGFSVAGTGDNPWTWNTKALYSKQDNSFIKVQAAVGKKYAFGIAYLESAYWLTLDGQPLYTEDGNNLLGSFDAKYTSWIVDGAKIYFGFGSYNPATYNVYSVREGARMYGARELYDMPVVGTATHKFIGYNMYSEFVAFDAGMGVDIPLDVTKDISVTIKGGATAFPKDSPKDTTWVSFGFTTEPSAGGLDGNAKGSGFTFLTRDYGGLKLEFYRMENGLKGNSLADYRCTSIASLNPNKDGVVIGNFETFTFEIKPEGESFGLYLNGTKMTVEGEGSFFDAFKDGIGTFADENGKTYFNVAAANNPETGVNETGYIYEIRNGDRIYTAAEIAQSSVTALPKVLSTSTAQAATGEGSYSGGLPVLDFAVDFSVEEFTEGTKTLTFSDGETSGATVTLGFADGKLTAAVGNGSSVNVGVSAGEYVRAALSLENGKAYLTMNGTRIGEINPISIADANGKTYLSFGGTNTEASLFFFGLREQELRTLKTAVTVAFSEGEGEAKVALLNAAEEEIASEEFVKDGTHYVYAAADAAPAKIRVSAEGFAEQTVNFAATANVTLETLAYSGTIMLTADGKAVSGATVTLKQGSSTLTMAESATAGTYTISNLRGVYTVTVEKAGYEFPSAQISSESTVAVAAVSWPYTGSVTVTANGKAVSGATVTLKQGESTLTLTESADAGVYTAENLSGTYAVTVAKEGLVFEEQTLRFGSGSVTAAAKTFEGVVTVKVGTVGIAGAQVAVSETGIGVTDNGDGTYTLGAFAGSYTVTVTKDGYSFGEAVTLSNTDASCEVSGTYSAQVAVKVDDEALEGATVIFSGSTVVTATYSNGVYTASGLVGDYTVTATKDGYTIASGSISATARSAHLRAIKNSTEEEEKPEDKKGCGSVGLGGWAGLGGMGALLVLPFAFKRRRRV